MANATSRSVDLDTLPKLLILVADELDQLVVRLDALIDANGPWLRVRLRVLEGEVDLQTAEVRAAEALGELRLLTVGASVDVEPSVVGTVLRAPQVVGLDDERVITLPCGSRGTAGS